MSQDLMNISAFKGLAPASAFKEALDPNSESLADGIGQSYGIVGYAGKTWTLRYRGENYTFYRPDDPQVPAPYLDVIILRSPPFKSKSYYTPGSFIEGQSAGKRPICAALSEDRGPDPDIVTPQATHCSICPKNVFKLNPEGRKTKDCADYKRLAVLILPSMTKAVMGAALMEPVFLRIPPASLTELAALGEGMDRAGFHFSAYVTRIGFRADKKHPQMTFRALQALTNREAPMVLPLRDDYTAKRITGESDIAGRPAPVQRAIAAPGGSQGSATPVTAAVSPAPASPAPTVPQAAVAIDLGFSDVGEASPPDAVQKVSPAPVSNIVVDTGGDVEDADDDLDARVAALMPKVN